MTVIVDKPCFRMKRCVLNTFITSRLYLRTFQKGKRINRPDVMKVLLIKYLSFQLYHHDHLFYLHVIMIIH